MKVKDIVIKAAALLGGADEVKTYLAGSSTNGRAKAELLLSCFNIVENELALDYIPLIKEESFTTADGEIDYASFSEDVVRILEVRNTRGAKIPFRLFASYMETDPDTVTVRYAYTPKEKTATDESDFRAEISERVMAFGTAAEYCTAIGVYEDARVWDKKYKEGIEAARSIGVKKKMPSRRWA